MASDSISLNALHPEHRRFADLKSRLAALNCELFEDESGDDGVDDHYYVLDKTKGKLVSVCASMDDTYDWLEAREKERATPAPTPTDSLADDNPIRAFLLATKWLDGSCFCANDEGQRGHELVSAIASSLDKDDEPTLPLTKDQCADILEFLTSRQEQEQGHVRWSGGDLDEDEGRQYGGDPGWGLFVLANHIAAQLRNGNAAATEVANA